MLSPLNNVCTAQHSNWTISTDSEIHTCPVSYYTVLVLQYSDMHHISQISNTI